MANRSKVLAGAKYSVRTALIEPLFFLSQQLSIESTLKEVVAIVRAKVQLDDFNDPQISLRHNIYVNSLYVIEYLETVSQDELHNERREYDSFRLVHHETLQDRKDAWEAYKAAFSARFADYVHRMREIQKVPRLFEKVKTHAFRNEFPMAEIASLGDSLEQATGINEINLPGDARAELVWPSQ